MDMNALNDLPAGPSLPDIVNVIIENPKCSQNKYELDKATGLIKLDRVLFSAVHFPGDYGFVPQTHCEDGDPLDALLLSTQPFFPGVLVEARVIGALTMVDKGEQDDKLLCVPDKDPRFKDFKSIKDVPKHILDEIANFYSTYKILENKKVDVKGWVDASEAKKLVRDAVELYKKQKK